jgi:hypothetical protein
MSSCFLSEGDITSVLPFTTGCGSAWLERHVRDVEAVGSNPTSPTRLLLKSEQSTACIVCRMGSWLSGPCAFPTCGSA